ncbi:MAG: hypothetical protein ABIK28_08370 [Planctomycetota bacterium]
MVPSKKHPLEVFRMQGGTFSSLTTGKKQNAPNSRSSRDKAAAERSAGSGSAEGAKKEAGKPGKETRNHPRSAPGDQRFMLSLNGVLFIAVVIVGLSIGAYFLGFQKGQKLGDTGAQKLMLQHQDRMAEPGMNIGEFRSQDPSNKGVTADLSQSAKLLFGVQVGTWDVSKSSTANEANEWLQKNGYNSKLYPFANGKKLIIIVGSFQDKQDRELNTLLGRIRAINDYPFGASSPFKDAQIKPFSVRGVGKQG